eukprot:TRINITY_DN17358_c0_g1_i1.p1 TRINITY_DN17358_c0_g1~~TRINITY_DN17358_c0_g1_i1.p1  ORF type:complete len:127 (-),score=15.07 TRINITY_DN17358_c0_g1_i1:882-1262(-)
MFTRDASMREDGKHVPCGERFTCPKRKRKHSVFHRPKEKDGALGFGGNRLNIGQRNKKLSQRLKQHIPTDDKCIDTESKTENNDRQKKQRERDYERKSCNEDGFFSEEIKRARGGSFFFRHQYKVG